MLIPVRVWSILSRAYLLSCFALGTITASFGQTASDTVLFPDVKDLATVKITLIRTRCGTCLSYQVEVDGSGAVVFHGGDFVLVPGRHTAHVPEASVRALLEAFQRADYFSAKDSYAASVTDYPTYITSLSIDGRSKKVIDYAGKRAGMPDSIRTLEEKIDEVAGTRAQSSRGSRQRRGRQAWRLGEPRADCPRTSTREGSSLQGSSICSSCFVRTFPAGCCYVANSYRHP
jgi:hypothetical protein